MAKGNIDPAMQAAPYLGDSSHDPIEFTRRQNTIKYQRSKQKQAEIERNTAKGLDKLMIDLDGWNDKEGFKEVISRQQKAKDMYMGLATKGVNFVNPTTEGEVMAYKALTDYQAKTKEIADLRNAQKVKIDLANKLIQADAAKPPEDQLIDHEATRLNTEQALKASTIADRDELLNNLIVTKPQIGDSYDYVEKHKNALPKLDQIQVPYTDPQTGQQGTRLEVQWTPEKTKETEKKLRELYRGAPEKIKNAVKIYREQNTDLKIASDEDAFVAQHMPQYAEKLIKKVSGSGGGLNFSFLGTKASIVPGELQNNELKLGERTYGERYQLDSKPIYKVPTGGGMMQDEDMKWNPISVPGYAEANLMFYDPNKDELVFRTTSSSQTPGIEANITFSVPRKNVKDAEKYPVKLPNGSMGTLKDVMPKPDPKAVGRNTVLKNSGISWK